MTQTLLTTATTRRCDRCRSEIEPGDVLSWNTSAAKIVCGPCSATIAASPVELIVPVMTRSRRAAMAAASAAANETDAASGSLDELHAAAEHGTTAERDIIAERDITAGSDIGARPDAAAWVTARPDAATFVPTAPDAVTDSSPSALPVGAPTRSPWPAPDPIGLPIELVDGPSPSSGSGTRSELLDAFVGAATAAGDGVVHHSPAASVTLTQRGLPRMRATIDRIVVTASGVLVVDERCEAGPVGIVESRRGRRLTVGRRDRTKMLRRVALATEAVAGSLVVLGMADLAVTSVQLFDDGQLTIHSFADVDGVTLVEALQLEELIDAPGSLAPADVERLAELLGDRFPSR